MKLKEITVSLFPFLTKEPPRIEPTAMPTIEQVWRMVEYLVASYSSTMPNFIFRMSETLPDPARPTPKLRELRPMVMVKETRKTMFTFSLEKSIYPPASVFNSLTIVLSLD